MKNKAISYSLWGSNPIYHTGILRNAEYIAQHLPDWQMVVWYDSSILVGTSDLLDELRALGAECYFRPNRIRHSSIMEYGTFWRFRTIDLKKYTHIIFRDADSRLSARDMAAVDEWIRSQTILHVIRDHPYHNNAYPINRPGILGGLWGIWAEAVELSMDNMIANYYEARNFKPSGYGSDQEFLTPLLEFFKGSVLIHDEIGGTGLPFPLPRDGFAFCGERINPDESPFPHDRDILQQFLKGGAK